jgi:hypothetical protein
MNDICVLIVGELESPKQAREYAKKMKSCPHMLFSVVEGDTL